jgi:hypothetical protein
MCSYSSRRSRRSSRPWDSRVDSGEACPSRFCSVSSRVPPSHIRVACVWRRACGVTQESPDAVPPAGAREEPYHTVEAQWLGAAATLPADPEHQRRFGPGHPASTARGPVCAPPAALVAMRCRAAGSPARSSSPPSARLRLLQQFRVIPCRLNCSPTSSARVSPGAVNFANLRGLYASSLRALKCRSEQPITRRRRTGATTASKTRTGRKSTRTIARPRNLTKLPRPVWMTAGPGGVDTNSGRPRRVSDWRRSGQKKGPRQGRGTRPFRSRCSGDGKSAAARSGRPIIARLPQPTFGKCAQTLSPGLCRRDLPPTRNLAIGPWPPPGS